jgi:catechol 2,3-dioxygenase-like lactoylglutathione lyase family enzyme
MRSLGIRQFDFVTIYTRNLAASREFYVDRLEFPIIREAPNDFFQIDVAGVPICVDLDAAQLHKNNLAVVVSDLAATEAALRERNLAVHSRHNADERWLEVKDPDGNEVIFLVRQPVRTH